MPADDPFTALARRLVPRASAARRWPLEGGVSARIDALAIDLPEGTTRRVVVRRHGAADWKVLPPDVTATEFAVLEALHDAGVPVPEPLLLDTSGEVFPSPYLVMAFVEGRTDVELAALPDALRQMAGALARLHALDPAALPLPSLPRRDDPIPGVLRYLPDTPQHRAVRRVLAPRVPIRPAGLALLHGDFWPGNVLWCDGRLAAVIDWEDAAVGDPLADVAGCRVELLWRHGEAAMEAFTEHYVDQADLDFERLPEWELYVASAGAASMHQWGLAPEVEATMRRRTTWFLERAGRQVLSRRRGRAVSPQSSRASARSCTS